MVVGMVVVGGGGGGIRVSLWALQDVRSGTADCGLEAVWQAAA